MAFSRIADRLQARGEFDEALRIRREEELPIYEHLGDVRERAVALSQVAQVLQERGDLDEALRLYDEALASFDRMGLVRDRVILKVNRTIAEYRRSPDDAIRVLRAELLPALQSLGLRRDCEIAQRTLAVWLHTRNRGADRRRAPGAARIRRRGA